LQASALGVYPLYLEQRWQEGRAAGTVVGHSHSHAEAHCNGSMTLTDACSLGRVGQQTCCNHSHAEVRCEGGMTGWARVGCAQKPSAVNLRVARGMKSINAGCANQTLRPPV
jgi:hypothetical protein